MKGRYGGPCHTGDAERYLMAALPELLPRGRSSSYAVAWAQSWVPCLFAERGEEFIRQCWIRVAKRKLRNLTSDQLSRLLKVADDEPARLNLRCIPAASRTKKIRKVERLAKRAAAEAARRQRDKPNLTPRSQSLTAIKPWEAAGISRSKWYAMRKDEAMTDIVKMPEAACLDEFVATVSVTPSGQIRGHLIPYLPLQEQSGHEASGTEGANDNLRATQKAAPDGWRLEADHLAVRVALEKYPALDADLDTHLAAVTSLMTRTPALYRHKVARNLLRDRAHSLRREILAAA